MLAALNIPGCTVSLNQFVPVSLLTNVCIMTMQQQYYVFPKYYLSVGHTEVAGWCKRGRADLLRDNVTLHSGLQQPR